MSGFSPYGSRNRDPIGAVKRERPYRSQDEIAAALVARRNLLQGTVDLSPAMDNSVQLFEADPTATPDVVLPSHEL